MFFILNPIKKKKKNTLKNLILEKMWIKKIIETKVFNFLFIVSVCVLITVFIVNVFSGYKGTYDDHSKMIWALVNKKYEHPQKKKVSFESRGETECRRAIENLTGEPFPRSRPAFLLNKVSGQNLELDCYNENLKLAVEYNGEQHYKFIPYFHSNKDSFYNLKYRDEIKKQLCEQEGVKLIVVPYTVKLDDIEKYIEQKIKN
jgi:hypothetical protein